MDGLIIFDLLVIVLAGGFIGMMADVLGRKIGKQRRTLLHLRPKHVARLATFLAGTLASLVTITLVFFTSADIRAWIVEGRGAIAESKKLTTENEHLNGEISDQKSQLATLQNNARTAKKNLEASQSQLVAIQSKLTVANSQVEADKVALESSKQQLAQNQKDLAERQAQLKAVSGKYAAAQQKYQGLQGNYKALDKERKEANEQVLKLRIDKNALTDDVAEMKTKASMMITQNQKMEIKLEQDQHALDGVRSNLADVNSQLQLAQQDLSDKSTELKLFQMISTPSRLNRMTFAAGSEISRVSVAENLTPEEADASVQKLLEQSSVAVIQQGGVPPKPGGLAAEFFPMRPNENGTVVTGDEQREAIVKGLTGQSQGAVLIAYAQVNSFTGETAPIRIEGYSNKVIYTKDQVLASLEIGRKWNREKVLSALDGFRTEVRKRVAEDGIIPIKGHEDEILNVPQEDYLDLIDRITNAPRAVHVDVVARAQTRAADVLQAEFKIR